MSSGRKGNSGGERWVLARDPCRGGGSRFMEKKQGLTFVELVKSAWSGVQKKKFRDGDYTNAIVWRSLIDLTMETPTQESQGMTSGSLPVKTL